MVHRVDFHNALKQKAQTCDGALGPIPLHTSCPVTSVDLEKGSVTLEDGRQMSADLLIGADGIHVSREMVAYR